MRAGDAKLACWLFLIIPVVVCGDDGVHGICKKFQACGAIQRVYSIRPSTTTESTIDAVGEMTQIVGSGEGPLGSGEGSGEGSAEGTFEPPLLYDEFVPTAMDEHDTSADPTTTAAFQLCSCENNETCPLEETDENRLIRLDAYIALATCRPVAEEFPMQCKGRRAMIRVIGRLDADQTGRTEMVGFEDSIVFCSCASGRYHREPDTEPWKGGIMHAFKYSCG